MIGQTFALPALTGLPRRLYAPMGLVLGAAVLALTMTPLADGFVARLMIFYVATALAYGLMPLGRRGDIPLVAAWAVLLSELAPCLTGQLLSPIHVVADGLGVILAAVPVFIARFRQVQQGDVRPTGRRASDAA